MMGRFLARAPIVGDILYRIAIQRFAATFSSLLKSGMSILDSLEITADSVGHMEMREALLRISRDAVPKGLTIGEAFRREQIFPRVVVNLIAISEKAGHMENILDTLAEFYESEIDASTKTLISFLEPVLLLVIGFVVATIALAIIVPIYQLVGTIG
ncbi:MAG: type II secretion system F family protein [Patescibacteria group bacterium]